MSKRRKKSWTFPFLNYPHLSYIKSLLHRHRWWLRILPHMSLGKIWENSNSARTFAFRFLNANPNDKCLFSQFSEEEKRKILSRSFVWKLLLSVEVFSIQNVHNNISFTLVSYADAVSQQRIERLKRLQSFPWLFPLDINLNEKIVPHDLLTLLSTKKI